MKITKEEALKKIDELQSFVSECDQKQEVKKSWKIEIKNRLTGSILFQSDRETIKEAIVEAVENNANLSDANLRDANLRGADLCGADLMNCKFYGKTSSPKILTKTQVPVFLEALGFKIEH